MNFSFKHFEFDCENQILKKNGKIYTLNEKPARLLTLFLCEPNKIHNKADILEYVWPDRVVTEQVVFQNISYLRVIFGNNAIKTFVKKGYQWQLPLTDSVDEFDQVNELAFKNDQPQQTLEAVNLIQTPLLIKDKSHITSKADLSNLRNNKQSWAYNKLLISLSLLLMASLIYTLWLSPQQKINKTKDTLVVLSFEHKDALQAKFIKDNIENNKQLNVQFASAKIKNQALFDSPFRTWKVVAKSSDTEILATRLYDVNNGGVLRFHIQGKYRGWQGYISGVNQNERINQLNKLMTLLTDNEYFSVKSEHAALSTLTTLHNSNTENSLIAYQLINKNYELGYLDRATALANTMLEAKANELDVALLNLLKTKIYLANTNWKSALPSITIAIELFNKLNLLHLESLALIEKAWYELHNNNYPEIRKSLNLAIMKARMAGEPLQEMLSHLIQSSLASKDNKLTLMKNELESANQLFEFHQLGNEHQIPVFYTLAAAADSSKGRLLHYAAILERPFSPLYSKRFYYAAEALRDASISQQLWDAASASIKPWQRRSFKALSKAHIAFAKQNNAAAIESAIQAFRYAQIDYNLQDALNAALLLLQRTKEKGELTNSSEYIDYIKQNANHKWLRDNEPVLNKLLLKDVAA